MSPTRKQLAEQKRRQREQREERERLEREVSGTGPKDTEAAGPGTEVAIPSPGGEPDPLPAAPEEPYRPQPFTPDLIPEPLEIDAEGDLTPQELDELGHCEAAYANDNRAQWMKWKAAHAVRSRNLHRQGGRTWPVYCEDMFGESESEVNRHIQQWPLLKAITEQQARPRAIPDSHVQQLLPMIKQHGEETTARAYVALRVWAAERRHRVTAEVVVGLVELARAAESPALTTAVTFEQAIEAQPKPKPSRPAKREAARVETETAPVDTALDVHGKSEAATGSHPNLGDSEEAEVATDEVDDGNDETVVDAEIVDDMHQKRADDILSHLEGLQMGIEDLDLRGVRPETIKKISSAARSIARGFEQILKDL